MGYDIYPNGVNGVTGEYLGGETLREILGAAAQQKPETLPGYPYLPAQTADGSQKFLGLPYGIDPLNIGRAGWGIVFPAGANDGVREALKPLIEHRRRDIPPDRCKVLEYREGEGVRDWLTRHNVAPGNIRPTGVPFYLLLVGGPTEIAFDFQYLLSIEYAVGRLCFDEPDQYAQYALSVVSYETQRTNNQREVIFWAPRHDAATELSADYLVKPLTRPHGDEKDVPAAGVPGYRNRCFFADEATKQSLSEALNSARATPAMLFTASHGLGWPSGHEQQREKQGALVCQGWGDGEGINESHYFAASDIADGASLNGLVVFSFACYSAGTPAFDTFAPGLRPARASSQAAARIAETPFVATLPQKLLSHPGGSALAFIGHVDRAWGFSIKPLDVDAQLIPFRNCISRILNGEPVGLAARDFTQRYAMLSAALLSSLGSPGRNDSKYSEETLWAWIECTDAQSYITLGDPVARVVPC